MFQFSGEGIAELSARLADHTLGMQPVRVLMEMVQHTDKENRCHAGRKDLARLLGMDESAVGRAQKSLVDCGFLEAPKLRYSPYTISPRFFWRGSNPALKGALAARGMLDENGMMKAA